MQELVRFGVSAESELLIEFDRLLEKQGYNNRSEALRDLMRDALVRSHIESDSTDTEVLGSLTLVYDHHARELTEKMNELQHEHHELVVSAVHVHLSHHDCLEVIILRGHNKNVRTLADGLLSLKGVKHGDLFLTLPAGKIHETHHTSNAETHQNIP